MDMRNHQASAFEGWAPPWYDSTAVRPFFERYDLDFFRRWTSTVPSVTRMVGAAISARRRAGADVFPWLGPDPKLMSGDLPYLVFRALQSEDDMAVLTSILAQVSEKKARVFADLVRGAERAGTVVLAKTKDVNLRHRGMGRRRDEVVMMHFVTSPKDAEPVGSDVVFCTLIETGPAFLEALFADVETNERWVSGLVSDDFFVGTLHPWLVGRYPHLEHKALKKAESVATVRERVKSDHEESSARIRCGQMESRIAELREETVRLQALVDTTSGLLHLAETEKAEQAEEMRGAWAQVLRLQRENLELRTMGVPSEPLPEALPTNYEDFEAWSQTAMAGRVVVLPRALRTTKKSRSVDISRLVKAVAFLRDVYVPMRRGSEEAKAVYREALTESGFDESQSLSDKASYEGLPGYYVDWNGRRFVLDRHLKRGKGTDMRSMIRIYFAWDEEAKVVLIGHMPTHLEIWNTN